MFNLYLSHWSVCGCLLLQFLKGSCCCFFKKIHCEKYIYIISFYAEKIVLETSALLGIFSCLIWISLGVLPSWRPRCSFPPGIGRALSPEGVTTCFKRRSESPSCICRVSNSFSLKYLVCPGAHSELCYCKANRLIILGTLACFSKKQASGVLMLKELLSEGKL